MITTWLNEQELKQYSHVVDEELNELFQEVMEKFEKRVYLEERKIYTKRFFITKELTLYTLYIHNGHEAQIVNFADPKYSINTLVTKEFIMTYFYGLLSGLNYNKK